MLSPTLFGRLRRATKFKNWKLRLLLKEQKRAAAMADPPDLCGIFLYTLFFGLVCFRVQPFLVDWRSLSSTDMIKLFFHVCLGLSALLEIGERDAEDAEYLYVHVVCFLSNVWCMYYCVGHALFVVRTRSEPWLVVRLWPSARCFIVFVKCAASKLTRAPRRRRRSPRRTMAPFPWT